jgi:hypothetical protein
LISPPFASYAWLLKGIRNTPGWLCLEQERLVFLTPEEVVFDVPRSQVSVTFPWYYFGGGMKVTAAGQRYKIAFVLPNDAEYPLGDPAAAGGTLPPLAANGASIREGRAVGRRWREVLGT